ncbi:MAG: hypothetical protein SX243_19085, partial [Acidobacteriota bacterium]|nr:hypothetical protein [Acidobacteriota bacterium]
EATVDLWRAAEERFAAAAGGAADQRLGADAEANRRFVQDRVQELEQLMANPPPECGGGGGGSAQEEISSPEGGSGSGQEPPPPPEDPEQDSPAGGASSSSSEPGSEPSADTEAGAGGSLGSQDLEQIREALERVEASGVEEGKFHRRTRAEQFSEESWRNPTEEIWW